MSLVLCGRGSSVVSELARTWQKAAVVQCVAADRAQLGTYK